MADRSIKPSNEPETTFEHSMPHSRWLGEQLTILAEAMGETLSQSRLTIYAQDLADLSKEQLQRAFWQARRQLRFFPKIAELRELAGLGSPKEQLEAEALRAWE